MVMNIGIRPALKYMVITMKRYQNLRCHIFSWVNIKPRNALAITVSTVPMTVRATEMKAEVVRPLSAKTCL